MVITGGSTTDQRSRILERKSFPPTDIVVMMPIFTSKKFERVSKIGLKIVNM